MIETGGIVLHRYITEILETMPFAYLIGEDFKIIHKNTHPHDARVLQKLEITTFCPRKTQNLTELNICRILWEDE